MILIAGCIVVIIVLAIALDEVMHRGPRYHGGMRHITGAPRWWGQGPGKPEEDKD